MQSHDAPDLRRKTIWSVATLIVIAVLVLGVFNAVALPGCGSCHDRDGFRVSTAAAAHAGVDCRSCHVPAGPMGRLAFSFRQPLHMFVPISGGAERDAAAVPDSRCLACHEDVLTTLVTANGIRIPHASCAAGAVCSDCHSATAHGGATPWVRAYDMDRCLSCHVDAEQTACDLCHEDRGPTSRIKSGTFAATHGPQWRKTHGMGNAATCTVCHEQGDCVECHGPGLPHRANFVDVHAEYGVGKDAKCAGCHEASFCDTCHGTPMPHTAQFTRDHATTAAAQPAECERCHAESDCTICHEKHVHPGGAIGGAPTGGGGR